MAPEKGNKLKVALTFAFGFAVWLGLILGIIYLQSTYDYFPLVVAIVLLIVIILAGPTFLVYKIFKSDSVWRYPSLVLVIGIIFKIFGNIDDITTIVHPYFWTNIVFEISIIVFSILAILIYYKPIKEKVIDNVFGEKFDDRVIQYVDSSALLKALDKALARWKLR